jgi:hypothetical protein
MSRRLGLVGSLVGALTLTAFAACGGGTGPGDEATGGQTGETGGATASGGSACVSDCEEVPGSGGALGTGGAPDTGGAPSTGGLGGLGGQTIGSGGVDGSAGNSGGPDHCLNQTANQSPEGTSGGIVDTANVVRNGVDYMFYTGQEGAGLLSSSIEYRGTSFDILALDGDAAPGNLLQNPVMFCGELSTGYLESEGICGLPVELDQATRIDFGARYSHDGSGSDYSYFIDLRLLGTEETWITVAPRLSDSFALDDLDITTGVLVGADPEPWSVGFRNVQWPALLFFRPETQGTEFAGDARDFIAIANGDYDFGAETLAAIGAAISVYGPVSDLSLGDFCVQVE